VLKTYTKSDIENIINEIGLRVSERLDLFIGTGDNERLVVRSGLKIRHKETGIVYTVVYIDVSDRSNPKIICNRPGITMEIQKEEFKNYERQ
tara:strand:+ start:15889 stop:16164 length:276 start_codon:yes stop_codon:yes gene_type:complete